jgi:hypothetical protein
LSVASWNLHELFEIAAKDWCLADVVDNSEQIWLDMMQKLDAENDRRRGY